MRPEERDQLKDELLALHEKWQPKSLFMSSILMTVAAAVAEGSERNLAVATAAFSQQRMSDIRAEMAQQQDRRN